MWVISRGATARSYCWKGLGRKIGADASYEQDFDILAGIWKCGSEKKLS